MRSFISAILQKFGRLDHVFNCAGINPTNIPFEETTLEYWDKQCNTNLKGVFLITRESLPHLKRGSSIVTVSSMSGTRGTPLQSVYRYLTSICLLRKTKFANFITVSSLDANKIAPLDLHCAVAIVPDGSFRFLA